MDLPEYRLRVSPRAKYLRITVTERDGVVVVLPRGMSPRHVEPFVREKRAWIERALLQIESHRPAPESLTLPDRIYLPAIDESWGVDYLDGTADRTSLRETYEGRLRVHGDTADRQAVEATLKRWLMRHAQRTLPPWLTALARMHGLQHGRISVRAQRTRWGSCNQRGDISLNFRLLFLAPELVCYVLLHELAHTRHLNHSKRFWALVERMEPEYRAREKTLRAAAHELPRWVERL
ncbi:MAG: SprT family zinc-dependent metalloprotease [Gammaproteobacteria bacterium]